MSARPSYIQFVMCYVINTTVKKVRNASAEKLFISLSVSLQAKLVIKASW